MVSAHIEHSGLQRRLVETDDNKRAPAMGQVTKPSTVLLTSVCCNCSHDPRGDTKVAREQSRPLTRRTSEKQALRV